METTKQSFCPHCRQEVDPKATKCPHCQSKIKRWTNGKKILAGVLGLLVFIVIFSAVSGGSTSSTSPNSASSVAVGSEGYLHVTGGTGADITVLKTKPAFDEYIKGAVANDTRGMAEIVARGDGFFVKDGTKVLVIDLSGDGARQVRIEDGQFSGESGWVPAEFVSAQ